ncbi:hypothetical protein FKF97_11070 [Clostridium perfringens]|nr:hypothetical protein [Clostridium perfringens]
MVNLTTYDEYNSVEPKEFFDKTRKEVLNLNRITFDNCRCNLISKLTGQAFRDLLNGIKEENESEDEYILILKTKNVYYIRQEVRDELEDETVINEWEMRY